MESINGNGWRTWRGRLVLLPLVIVIGWAVGGGTAGHAAYRDTPAPNHRVGQAFFLVDLTPPGILLTPGVLGLRPGRVTLRPGIGGGVYFLPNWSTGPRRCFGGSNAAIAGVICGYTDNIVLPGVGWHGEIAIHNPNVIGLGFNAAFSDGWGNLYAGPAFLGPGSTLYLDIHTADSSLPHFSEAGISFAWVASTISPFIAPQGLDVSFTVSEGVHGPDGVFACPLRVATIQGLTPQGSFGCSFRFFSDPSDSWIDAPDDPSLPRVSIMDPDDRSANPDVFPDLEPLVATELNHFQCYEVHAPNRIIANVSLTDQFGASTVDLIEARRLCNPADKNHEDPSAPSDPQHLVGYRLQQRTPKFVPVKEAQISNQFGTIIADLVKPDYLLAPSAKSLSDIPAPLTNPTLDHFKCYRLARARQRASAIAVDDQFGSLLVDVKKPERFCTAVDKNGEGILDPAANLTCYTVRLATTSPQFSAPGRAFVNNQFGLDQFPVTRPTELCVPSLLLPP